jgi:hypothetical protein
MLDTTTVSTPRRLSGNFLKLIAAMSMLMDHIGVVFFPGVTVYRVIGRLALPIFAFMIAEGCHFTRNRLHYFLSVFVLGALCQTVYFCASGDTYLNILLTFSCSILMVYLLQEWRRLQKHVYMLPFAATVAAAYLLSRYVRFDYGFWGMMIPVFVAAAYPDRGEKIGKLHHLLRVGMLALALIPSCMEDMPLRLYSFMSLPLLLLYSGKRGKGNFKYGFYLFYPLHLVVLQVIDWLIT